MATKPTYNSGDHNAGGFEGRFLALQTTVVGEQIWITNRLAYHWDRHPEGTWGDERSEAVLLRSAVDFDVEKQKQKAGKGGQRVKSKSAGGWSKAYAEALMQGTESQAYLMLSPEYGGQYLALMRRTVQPPGII